MPARSSSHTITDDEAQLTEVLTALTRLIDGDTPLIQLAHTLNNLGGYTVAGSALDQAQRAGTIYLSRLTRQEAFLKFKHSTDIPEHYAFQVDQDGQLWAVKETQKHQGDLQPQSTALDVVFSKVVLTPHAKAAIAGIEEDLQLLASMAKQAGGSITSNARMSIGQWLHFHGLKVPANLEETRQLIDMLGFVTLPPRPPLENYWQLLDAPVESPFHLTAARRAIIAEHTLQLNEDAPLLTVFAARLHWQSAGATHLPTSIDYRMQGLLDIARRGTRQAQGYLDALGWFSGEDAEGPSQDFIDHLLIAVMLLELDPDLDSSNTAFAGFDLYAKRFLLQKPATVRRELEQHLTDRFQLQASGAAVVAHWVLAGMAPQFLVRDLPSDLKIGTPGCVVLCQAVHLVEAISAGASRAMSYEHLLGFNLVPSLVPALAPTQALNNLDPVVTWALMNDLIAADSDGRLSQATVSRAIDEYDRYVSVLTRAINDVNQPAPSRRPIALKELTTRVPGCNPEELLVKHAGRGGSGGRKVSVLDLYMGDELHTTDWGRTRGRDIYKEFPQLTDLYPANQLYEEAIHAHHAVIKTSLSTNIKYAFSQMEEPDRTFLESSRLAIYTLEKQSGELANTLRPVLSLSPASVLLPPLQSPIESGRYGVIICAANGPWVRCYELFPLRLHCRFNSRFDSQFSFRLIDSTGQWVDRKLIADAPVDLAAYLKNAAPRADISTSVVLTKIGEFGASDHEATASSPVRFFQSARIAEISTLVAEENTFLKLEELRQIGLDQTDREKAIEKTEKVFNVILNLIIPFKECVEEMSSGVAQRQRNAIAGCIMEAALIAVSFVAAPLKLLGAAAKGASLVTRLLSASRVAAHTVVSLFNPLDGLPKLLTGGGKLLGRGMAKLNGHILPNFARAQLLRLTGSSSYDLLKAVNHSGSATELRMTLDVVEHGRAVFKNDRIETAEHVLKHLFANDRKQLKHIPDRELQHLMANALAEIALKSDSARQLGNLLDPKVVEQLARRHAQTYYLENLRQFTDPLEFPEVLQSTLKVEYKNLAAMQDHQRTLLSHDLGKRPYHGIADEARFNPRGLTDNTERAAEWILKTSNSQNEADTIRQVLKEYSANNKPLTDPAVYKALHRRIAPNAIDAYRSPRMEVRYPSNISGAALLEKHLASLDPAHEDLAKHLFGSFLGYHAFSDGNGRTARAVYAITELRKGRFTALDRAAEDALSGLG